MRQSLDSRVYEGADIIDSRDIIARISELEDQRDAATEDEPMPDDDADELARLTALAGDASGSPDWTHGEGLIADSHFEDYARELAEDIGAIKSNAGWPACHIDWPAAADALKQDYMSVTYGSTEYWIRA